MGAHPDELLRFVARFDRREFWLAHEELEELWQVDRQDFYKGLIQLAAAFVHVERRNWNGAQRLLGRAQDYLAPYSGDYAGFDRTALSAAIGAARARVEALGAGAAGGFDGELTPELGSLFAGEIPEGIVGTVELPYRVRRYEDGYRPVPEGDPSG